MDRWGRSLWPIFICKNGSKKRPRGCPFSATKCNTYRETCEKRCLWLSFFSNEMQHLQRTLQEMEHVSCINVEFTKDRVKQKKTKV